MTSPVSISFLAPDGSTITLPDVARITFTVDRMAQVAIDVSNPKISLVPEQTVLTELVVTNTGNDTVTVELTAFLDQGTELAELELVYDRASPGASASIPLAPKATLPVQVRLTGTTSLTVASAGRLLLRSRVLGPDGRVIVTSAQSTAEGLDTRLVDDGFDVVDVENDGLETVPIDLIGGGFLAATKSVSYRIPVPGGEALGCFADGARLTDRRARSHCAIYTIRISGLEDLGSVIAQGIVIEDPLPDGVRFAGVRRNGDASNPFRAPGVEVAAVLSDGRACTPETHVPGTLCTVRVTGASLGPNEDGEIEIATIIR